LLGVIGLNSVPPSNGATIGGIALLRPGNSLEAARVPFRAKVDSMYTALASYLAGLPPTFDGDAAAKRIRDTNNATWKCVADQGKPIQAVLSPAQMQLLRQPVISLLTKGFTGTIWALPAARWW
jgi:hypothetical protein